MIIWLGDIDLYGPINSFIPNQVQAAAGPKFKPVYSVLMQCHSVHSNIQYALWHCTHAPVWGVSFFPSCMYWVWYSSSCQSIVISLDCAGDKTVVFQNKVGILCNLFVLWTRCTQKHTSIDYFQIWKANRIFDIIFRYSTMSSGLLYFWYIVHLWSQFCTKRLDLSYIASLSFYKNNNREFKRFVIEDFCPKIWKRKWSH